MGRAKLTPILLVLLAITGTIFVIRGPVRAVQRRNTINDFLSPYIQGKAWLLGENPYDPEVFSRLWPEEAGSAHFLTLGEKMAVRFGVPSPYPLTAFPLLAPFSALDWPIANWIWLGVSLVAFVFSVAGVTRLAQSGELRWGWLLLAALALAPFHTGISTGNAALPVFALAVAAVLAAERNCVWWAVVFLICALALKPTVALPFAIYILARKNWRVVSLVALGGAGLMVLAYLRLLAGHAGWIANFLRNNQLMFGSGGVNDFSSANNLRFNLLNFQVIAFQLVPSRDAAQIVAWAVFVVWLAAWIWSLRRLPASEETRLLDLSLLALLTILPLYHRFYDAVVVLLPVAWAMENFHTRLRAWVIVCLGLAAVFVLPGPSLFAYLSLRVAPLGELGQSRMWNLFVMSHEIWAILLLATVLLAARWRLSDTNEHSNVLTV